MSAEALNMRHSVLGDNHPGLPHGTVLGKTKCGLPGYNCNYKNNPDDDSKARAYDYGNFENGVYTGMKWQCVEFARRYWIYRRNVMIPNVQWAAHIIRFKEVARYKQGKYFNVPLKAYYNGCTEKPQEDDLLIYKSTEGLSVGHVAVVLGVGVSEGGNVVFVGEQNCYNDKIWPGEYADELPLTLGTAEDGKTLTYSITHRSSDLDLDGWVRLEEDKEYPRPKWREEKDFLVVDGLYGPNTTKALQTFCGGFADGDHGGLTNANLRVVLLQYARSKDDAPQGHEAESICTSLRRFIKAYWPLCNPFRRKNICSVIEVEEEKRQEEAAAVTHEGVGTAKNNAAVQTSECVVPEMTEEAYIALMMQQPLTMEQSICGTILKAAPAIAVDKNKRTDGTEIIAAGEVAIKAGFDAYAGAVSVGVCLTTLSLQTFLNTIRHPHDIPSAMEQLGVQR